jgi:hypothetical protein
MQTCIAAVDENGYTLRLALELLAYIVERNGYDFEATDWP